jgi:hypothetical protein
MQLDLQAVLAELTVRKNAAEQALRAFDLLGRLPLTDSELALLHGEVIRYQNLRDAYGSAASGLKAVLSFESSGMPDELQDLLKLNRVSLISWAEKSAEKGR